MEQNRKTRQHKPGVVWESAIENRLTA